MSKIDIQNIDDEILYGIRNGITDPSSRGSSGTQTITGSGVTTYPLAQAGITNVTSILIDSGTKTYGQDYTLTAENTMINQVVFATAVTTGSSIVANYHYGSTWVYPDSPNKKLSLHSFPRIAITDVSTEISEFDLNAASNMSSKLKQIQVIGANPKLVTGIVNNIKDWIVDNKKGFYYMELIIPVNISPVTTWDDRGSTEIVQQSITVEIPFIYEK
jgi:hypothetical protein